mgnify:CR=1 FL=1
MQNASLMQAILQKSEKDSLEFSTFRDVDIVENLPVPCGKLRFFPFHRGFPGESYPQYPQKKMWKTFFADRHAPCKNAGIGEKKAGVFPPFPRRFPTAPRGA